MGAEPSQPRAFISTPRLIKKYAFFFHRLKNHAEHAISDEIFEKRSERWPEETPDTKEAYFMRDIFDGEFVY